MTQNTNAITDCLPIYIPIVGDLTEQQIIYIFLDNNLGNVKRVDFITTCGGCKGAFVHFNFWCNSFNANTLWHFLDSNGSHKFWFSDKYLIIRKIKHNFWFSDVHQYAKITELEAKIADLETKMKEQNELNSIILQRAKEDAEYWKPEPLNNADEEDRADSITDNDETKECLDK